MAITADKHGTITITGQQDINLYSMLVLRGELKLEIKGLKCRGGSRYAYIKRTWNLKGTRESVLAQFEAIIEEAKANRT